MLTSVIVVCFYFTVLLDSRTSTTIADLRANVRKSAQQHRVHEGLADASQSEDKGWNVKFEVNWSTNPPLCSWAEIRRLHANGPRRTGSTSKEPETQTSVNPWSCPVYTRDQATAHFHPHLNITSQSTSEWHCYSGKQVVHSSHIAFSPVICNTSLALQDFLAYRSSNSATRALNKTCQHMRFSSLHGTMFFLRFDTIMLWFTDYIK